MAYNCEHWAYDLHDVFERYEVADTITGWWVYWVGTICGQSTILSPASDKLANNLITKYSSFNHDDLCQMNIETVMLCHSMKYDMKKYNNIWR